MSPWHIARPADTSDPPVVGFPGWCVVLPVILQQGNPNAATHRAGESLLNKVKRNRAPFPCTDAAVGAHERARSCFSVHRLDPCGLSPSLFQLLCSNKRSLCWGRNEHKLSPAYKQQTEFWPSPIAVLK